MIIIPDVRSLSVAPRYCPVRPRYMKYESAYSILSRFALYNVIHGQALVKIFVPTKKSVGVWHNRYPSLSRSSSLNAEAIDECFDLDKSERDGLFLISSRAHTGDHISPDLRVCQVCLAQGVHYSIFQFLLIQQCPVHQVDLTRTCRTCGGTMDYSLNSKLFFTPYGCRHCGKLLRIKDGQHGQSYLNKYGVERLAQAQRIFECGKQQRVFFEVNLPTNIYFDNTAQYSSSVQSFSRQQREMFDDIQAKVITASDKEMSCFLRIPNIATYAPAKEFYSRCTSQDLLPILKSLFRHIRKRFFPGVKLSKQRLAGMWRGLEGSEIILNDYRLVSYLDWMCFWYGVQAPVDLLSRVNPGGVKKLGIWLESKEGSEVFFALKGTREKSWLIRKIFAHEVLVFLARQFQSVPATRSYGYRPGEEQVVYKRAIGPAAWALVVLPNPVQCQFRFFGPATETRARGRGL